MILGLTHFELTLEYDVRDRSTLSFACGSPVYQTSFIEDNIFFFSIVYSWLSLRLIDHICEVYF